MEKEKTMGNLYKKWLNWKMRYMGSRSLVYGEVMKHMENVTWCIEKWIGPLKHMEKWFGVWRNGWK